MLVAILLLGAIFGVAVDGNVQPTDDRNSMLIEPSSLPVLPQEGDHLVVDLYGHPCFENLVNCRDKMIVSFWLWTSYQANTTVLSTGGDDSYSNGVNIQQHCEWYNQRLEIESSVNETVWKQTLPVMSSVWVHIVIAVNPNGQFTTFVDGTQFTLSPAAATSRIFIPISYIMFPDLELVNPRVVSSVKLRSVGFLDAADPTVIADAGVNQTSYMMGCADKVSFPASRWSTVNSGATVNDAILTCRLYCSSNSMAYALFDAHSCDCLSIVPSGMNQNPATCACVNAGTCAMVSAFRASSQLRDMPDSSPHLWVQFSTPRTPIETGDVVRFSVSIANPEVDLLADFGAGDGAQPILDGDRSYVWTTNGTYAVRFTATSRWGYATVEQKDFAIDVVTSMDHVEMQAVAVAVSRQPAATPLKSVQVQVTAFGGVPFRCQLSYGDGQQDLLSAETDRYNQMTKTHQYAAFGHYNVQVNCSNRWGWMDDSTLFLVSDFLPGSVPMVEKFFSSRGSALLGVPDYYLQGRVLSVIDNRDHTYSFDHVGQNLVISHDQFTALGDYFLTIQSDKQPIRNFLLHLQSPVGRPTVVIDPEHVSPEDTVTVELHDVIGSHLFILWSFGDSSPPVLQYLLDAGAGSVLSQSIVANASGEFKFTVDIINGISTKHEEQIYSVESRTCNFDMYLPKSVGNTGEAVTLTIQLTDTYDHDPHYWIEVFPGDGRELVFYAKFQRPTLSHDFSVSFTEFGMFNVSVKLYNNVTHEESVSEIKVGSDLDSVEINYVTGPTGAVGVPSQFDVTIPSGNGISLSVLFGDGRVMSIGWDVLGSVLGNTFDPQAARRKRDVATDTSVSTSTSTMAGNQAVNDTAVISSSSSTTTTTTTTTSTNDPLLEDVPPSLEMVTRSTVRISYSYTSTGLYRVSVKASNAFGHAGDSLCPPITIGVNVVPQNLCSPTIVTTGALGLRSAPVVKHRGDINDVNNHAEFPCDNTITAPVKWAWALAHITGGSRDHTYLDDFCGWQEPTGVFPLPPRALPFGLYEIQIYSYVEQYPLLWSAMTTYLQVVQSNMVAAIVGGDTRQVNVLDDFYLEAIGPSGDPDVDPRDKDNTRFQLFCYQDIPAMTVPTTAMLLDSSRVLLDATTPAMFTLYDHGCFSTTPTFHWEDFVLKFRSTAFNTQTSLRMRLVVQKDSRKATTEQVLVTSFIVANNVENLEKQLDSVDDLALKNPSLALAVINQFATTLNSFDSSGNSGNTTSNSSTADAGNKMSYMRGRLLGTMGNMDLDDDSKVTAAASATISVTDKIDQMPTENQAKGADVIAKLGDHVSGMNGSDETVMPLIHDVIGCVGNILGAAGKTTPPVEDPRPAMFPVNDSAIEVDPASLPPARITAPLEYYACDECEICPEERVEMEREQKLLEKQRQKAQQQRTSEIAAKSSQGVDGAAKAMTSNMVGNDTRSVVARGLNVTVSTKPPSSNDSFGSDGGSIQMPTLDAFNGNMSNASSVTTRFMTQSTNAFVQSDTASKVKGNVVTLSFMNENGTEIGVHNSSEPFVISIPRSGALPQPQNYTYNLNGQRIVYHKLFVPDNRSSLHVLFTPENAGDVFTVYMQYGGNKEVFPTFGNYDWLYTFGRTRNSNQTTPPYLLFMSDAQSKGSGVYVIGVEMTKAAEVTVTDANRLGVNRSYSLTSYTASCLYWDVHHLEWRSDGCTVGRNTTAEVAQCLCTHLTAFGGDFYVPPNTINFSTVFDKFKNLSDNAAVFSTVIGVICGYIIVAIWARWQDKKDIVKWGATALKDNLPSDRYYYLVTINTGMKKEATTASRVTFVVTGETSDTGVRKLDDGQRKVLHAGSVNNYIMSCDKGLGPLTYLRIWHDNSGQGKRKSWFLDMVQIKDVQTGECFHFMCNNWLAVEKSDGKIERVLPTASEEDMTSFQHLFSANIRKKLSDGHIWFSVVSRPTKSQFTRLQRLSCCLSLLFMTMITNAMFFRSEDQVTSKTSLKIGPLTFTLTQLYVSVVSSMIVFPVNLVIVTLFRKAKRKGESKKQVTPVVRQQQWKKVRDPGVYGLPEDIKPPCWERFTSCLLGFFSAGRQDSYEDPDPTGQKKKKKVDRPWPHWCIYIAWLLIFACVFLAGFFTILYSMEWGRDKANSWLTAMFLSFFESLFVVDPMKVFILTAVIACIVKKTEDDDEESGDDDATYNGYGGSDEEVMKHGQLTPEEVDQIQRQRQTKVSPKELNTEDLARAREQRIKEVKMVQILREIAFYSGFIVILYFLCFQARPSNSIYIYNDLSNTFLQTLPRVSNISNFWDYVESNLLPGLYAQPWYNGKNLTCREKRMIGNRVAMRVGPARFRQLRIMPEKCKVHPTMRRVIHHCHADYNWIDDETRPYSVGWGEILNKSATPDKKTQYAWMYRDSIELKSAPYVGRINTYKGGGYTMTLPRLSDLAVETMAELKDLNWVDPMTRAVIVEFTIFNVNANLFASVTLTFEFPATGGVNPMSEIKVYRLYNFEGGFGIIVLLFEIIYALLIIYFFVREALEIKRVRMAYFKSFWNFNELITVSLGAVVIAMYGLKKVFANVCMDALHTSQLGEFINFNTLALWDEMFTMILGCVTFGATLKFMKLLRFNRKVGLLAATLKLAMGEIKSFALVFFLFYMAFVQSGFMLFGSTLANYSTMAGTFESLFAATLGVVQFNDMLHANVLGGIYFFAFILIVGIGLIGIFLTIINESFYKVKAELSLQGNEHEMMDFIWNSFKKMTGVGGGHAVKPTEKTADPNQIELEMCTEPVK